MSVGRKNSSSECEVIPEKITYDAILKARRDLNLASRMVKNIQEGTIDLNNYDPILTCCELGATHLEIATQLLESKYVNGDGLASMGEGHLAIAEKILKDPKLVQQCNENNIARIGAAHLDIAKHILEIEDLHKILRGPQLALLGTHLEIAERIFKDNNLINKCTSKNLLQMAKDNKKIAIEYQEYLKLKCDPADYFQLTMAYPELSKKKSFIQEISQNSTSVSSSPAATENVKTKGCVIS